MICARDVCVCVCVDGARLYKYWAAVRASVTEEDAVRGVLKGTDAVLRIRTFETAKLYFFFLFLQTVLQDFSLTMRLIQVQL